MSDKPETEVKVSTYTEAQKNATKKYRANNKEKVNEQRKLYYKARKEKDPQFLEYKRLKAKEYYEKKKSIVSEILDIPPPPKLVRTESKLEDVLPVISTSESEPEITSPPLEKPKLKRSKRKVKQEEPTHPFTETSTEVLNTLTDEDKVPLALLICKAIEELKIEDEKCEEELKVIDEGLKAVEEWRPTMIMIGSPPEQTPEPLKKTKKTKKEKKDI
jgi:hypothetical protein